MKIPKAFIVVLLVRDIKSAHGKLDGPRDESERSRV